MGAKTGISWTDSTWSPLRARVKDNAGEIARLKGYTSLVQVATKMQGHVGQHCEKVSGGCSNCYSESWQSRCLPVNGTGLPFDCRSRELIDGIVDEKALLLPLKWGPVKVHEANCSAGQQVLIAGVKATTKCTCKPAIRPRRIFVENQSDLFGEWYTFEQIRRVFEVICRGRGAHIYQILTKRPERMLQFFAWLRTVEPCWFASDGRLDLWGVWLGVSVENKKTADERVPLLLQVPAVLHWISLEPQLGPADLRDIQPTVDVPGSARNTFDALRGGIHHPIHGFIKTGGPTIGWVVQGGESGPGARPFDIQWARDVQRQCAETGTPYFLKQMGSKPFGFSGDSLTDCDACDDGGEIALTKQHGWDCARRLIKDRAGANPAEWPPDMRVQEFPK